MLFAICNTLTNRTYYIAGLPNSYTYLSSLITYNNNCPKTHFLAALYGFRNPTNLNNPFLPF